MGELVAVLLWEARPISEQNALVSAGGAQAASFEQLRLLWFGCLDVWMWMWMWMESVGGCG
jgi:hypothetical protein